MLWQIAILFCRSRWVVSCTATQLTSICTNTSLLQRLGCVSYALCRANQQAAGPGSAKAVTTADQLPDVEARKLPVRLQLVM